MSLINHAKREFALLNSVDEYNRMIEDCVLEVIEKVANQGHSGLSIEIFKNVLDTLLSYKPLTALTGEDDEWMNVNEEEEYILYQNIRASNVFKHVYKDGRIECYNIDGIVWYTMEVDEKGEEYKSYFTNIKSRTPVEFPYYPTTEYKEWIVEAAKVEKDAAQLSNNK